MLMNFNVVCPRPYANSRLVCVVDGSLSIEESGCFEEEKQVSSLAILRRPQGALRGEPGRAFGSPSRCIALCAGAVLATLACALPAVARAQTAPAPEAPGAAPSVTPVEAEATTGQTQTSATPGSSAPTKPASNAAPEEKYVDKLIDESLEGEDDGLSLEEREEGAQPLGRRYSAAEARYFRRDATGSRYTESGIVLQHRRETLDYGELSFEIQGRDAQESGPNPVYGATDSRAQFQFQQYRFPLTSGLFMDNSAGVVRLGPNALVGSSYRVQLPSVIASGVQSVTYRGEREMRVYSGRVGRLTGSATQVFEKSEGEVLGLGYKQALAPGWSAGVQVVDFKDSVLVPDHRSVAFAAQYEDRPAGRRFALHGLTDGRGGRGLWADGLESAGRWQHRYGLYRLPLNLLWVDTSIGSDSQGLYARTEYRTQLNSVAVGVDLAESNPTDDPSRSGTYTRSLYSTLHHRVSRDTFLNGSASVVDTKAKSLPVTAADSTSTSLSAGVGQRFAIGLSNFRVFVGRTNSTSYPRHIHGATWDHAWNVRHWQVSTALSYQKEDAAGYVTERKGATATFRTAIVGTATFDGGLQYTRSRQGEATDTDGLGANLNVSWTISRHWSSRLALLWNKAETTGVLTNGPTVTDKSLFFALRAEESSGRPYIPLGRDAGNIGTGKIVGWVFYDENGDGVRQASERPAPGVIVYLDGRFPVTSDRDGRFEFEPVPTGAHSLRLSVEQVPLPWGLLDESPRKVDVPLRDAATLEVPLSRITQ